MVASLILVLAAQVLRLDPKVVFAEKPPMLPSSLKAGTLSACAPTSLETAEKCLIGALSAEDLAIVQSRIPARQFRPSLDCEIETEWHLTDPGSPMARVMRDKLGIDRADFAAGMIISDIQARALGSGLPFDQLRQSLKQSPPPPSNECEDLKANNAAQEHKNAH
jgi:hypothetical protein